MSGFKAILVVGFGVALFATTANAESVEELKRELAAKKAYISKLEHRVRQLEKRAPVAEPSRIAAPAAVPVAPAAAPPPPPPPDDEEMEHALERTLVHEGALVLA